VPTAAIESRLARARAARLYHESLGLDGSASLGRNPARDHCRRCGCGLGRGPPEPKPEARQAGPARKSEQVRWTAAIGSAKSREWDERVATALEHCGPEMFAPRRVDHKPDLAQHRVATHVVDVPTRGSRASPVMGEPTAESTGSERTAHVGVESGREIEHAECPHPKPAPRSRLEEEEVGAGFTRNRTDRSSDRWTPRVDDRVGRSTAANGSTVNPPAIERNARQYHQLPGFGRRVAPRCRVRRLDRRVDGGRARALLRS
jgi:hypothetical protein